MIKIQLGNIITVTVKDEHGNDKICHAMILDRNDDLLTLKMMRIVKPPIQKLRKPR